MSKNNGPSSAIPCASWKRAPGTWAIYWLGLKLNRLGFGLEKAGAVVMAWAIGRLLKQRQASSRSVTLTAWAAALGLSLAIWTAAIRGALS